MNCWCSLTSEFKQVETINCLKIKSDESLDFSILQDEQEICVKKRQLFMSAHVCLIWKKKLFLKVNRDQLEKLALTKYVRLWNTICTLFIYANSLLSLLILWKRLTRDVSAKLIESHSFYVRKTRFEIVASPRVSIK